MSLPFCFEPTSRIFTSVSFSKELNTLKIKQCLLGTLLMLWPFNSFGQDTIWIDSTTWEVTESLGYYLHYSGYNGKWSISGREIRRSDSTLKFSSVYGYLDKKSCVFYSETKWFYENGMLKHHILYDFKRRKKAQIVDKEYSYSGDLVKTIIKTAQRKPKQTKVAEIEWH